MKREKREVFPGRACKLAGMLCIGYCLSIWLFVGFGSYFFLIWGVVGVILFGMGWLCADSKRIGKVMRWRLLRITWIRRILFGVVLTGCLVFLLTEGLIVSRFYAKAPADADYCIILGAQMKESGPSDVLRRRLDQALLYLEENPDTLVIVSGGRGANEPVTEAKGMFDYLVGKGVDPKRIQLEDASGNTVENLVFSSRYVDLKSDTVVLVTNNFHIFRAERIAVKNGYEKVHGLAADSFAYMVPNNLLREFFGVVKDVLAGNM